MRLVRASRVLPLLVASLALSALGPGRARAVEAPVVAWERSFDSYPELGGHGYEVLNDLVATDDGGSAAAGYSIPPGSYAPGGLPQQGLVVRLDASGAEVWRALLGEGNGDGYEVRRIRRTADGGFVVACVAWTPFGAGSQGMYYNTSFVAKLAGDGAELWRCRIDPLQMDALGDFDLLADGSVVAAGRVWRDGGGTFTALAKLSPSGSLLWLRQVVPDFIEGVSRVAATPDGGFYVTSAAGLTLTLSRYTRDGSRLWSTDLGGLDGPDFYYEKSVHGLTVNAAGGCVVAGAARVYDLPVYGPFRPFLATFDASGRQTATLVVPSASQWNHAVERLSDGGLISAEGIDGSDDGVVLARYDARGNELWRIPCGTGGAETYIGALRVTDGGVLAAGAVREPILWGPFDGYVVALDGGLAGVGPTVSARIDVRPGSSQNPVNCRAKGLLPVALLSSADFDASRVDPSTVALEGAPVARAGKSLFHAVRKDVDGDGRPDLLLHFSIPSLGLAAGTAAVTLVGTAPGGASFSASDRVRIVGAPAVKRGAPAGRGGPRR